MVELSCRVISLLNLLLIEKMSEDAQALKVMLSSVSGMSFAVEHVSNVQKATAELARKKFDVVLLSAHALLTKQADIVELRKAAPVAPIVVLCPFDERELIATAIAAGADNSLIKERVDGNRLALGLMYAMRLRMEMPALLTPEKRFLKEVETDLIDRMRIKQLPLREVLTEFILAIEHHNNFNCRCSILLMDHGKDRLRMVAAPNFDQRYSDLVDGIKVGPASGSCGTAAFNRHPIYVCDIENDALWSQFGSAAKQHGLKACWASPILDARNDVLGTLAFYYDEKRSPTGEEREFILAAAGCVANILNATSETIQFAPLRAMSA